MLAPLRTPCLRTLVSLKRVDAGALLPATGVQPVHQRGKHVELFWIVVLGAVVLARDRTEDVLGDLVRLIDDELEVLRKFQVHR